MTDSTVHPHRRQDDPKPAGTTELPTTRQRYACAAITGLLSNPNYNGKLGQSHPDDNLTVAKAAFALADAMVKAELE